LLNPLLRPWKCMFFKPLDTCYNPCNLRLYRLPHGENRHIDRSVGRRGGLFVQNALRSGVRADTRGIRSCELCCVRGPLGGNADWRFRSGSADTRGILTPQCCALGPLGGTAHGHW